MHRSRPQKRTVFSLVVAALLTALTAGVLAVPSQAAAPSSNGLTFLGSKRLTSRLVELTLHTKALAKDTHVRILLPADYAATSTRYPVLYLLNGGAGSYLDWVDQGEADKASAKQQMIIVMPDGGGGGNYTNWFGQDGSGQVPLWESYHIGQLIPWIDAHYRTVAQRSGRAVAGVSMGGNGAMHYAARHPDLFVAASAFSGAVDAFNTVIYPITETTGVVDGALPGAVFGPRATEEVRWRASNPPQVVGNLRSTWISLAQGNGAAGGPDGNQADPTEVAVHQSNVLLHNELVGLKVPVLWNDYGPGGHTWFYWKRDLIEVLPEIAKVFAQHRQPPTSFSYYSIDNDYSVYGWGVRLTRPVLEFSHLVNASSRGFVLEGSGQAVVTTPAFFPAGKHVKVTLVDAAGTHVRTVVIPRSGRLATSVDLGAANPFQAYTTQAKAAGTIVRQARITFRS